MSKYFVDSDLNNDVINIVIGDKNYGRIYHYLNKKLHDYEEEIKDIKFVHEKEEDYPIAYYKLDALINFINKMLEQFYN